MRQNAAQQPLAPLESIGVIVCDRVLCLDSPIQHHSLNLANPLEKAKLQIKGMGSSARHNS